MSKKEKPKSEKTSNDIPSHLYQGGVERFTVVVTTPDLYPLLSVHEFDKVNYRVNSIMTHPDGAAIEFVRVP